jgi:hypothetical protein
VVQVYNGSVVQIKVNQHVSFNTHPNSFDRIVCVVMATGFGTQNAEFARVLHCMQENANKAVNPQ